MQTHVGASVSSQHLLTQEEFNRFAAVSRDDNPIHVDPAFSARTRFGKPVAHGMFLYTLVHAALQAEFPGAMQISQDLMFPCPSFVGEQITISLKILAMNEREESIRLETRVVRPNGDIGLQGETVIRWKRI